MPRGRSIRQKRQRIFVACEGESERGYAAFLSKLAEGAGLALHLDIRLCNGGDPLAIVENALDEMSRRIRSRGPYIEQLIFLDSDRRGDMPERTMQADRLIAENALRPVWSNPAFEALLLRHLPRCERLRPATSDLAMQELRRRWPSYTKGMTANELRHQLDIAAVRRAATVDAELRSALTVIGLPL